MSTQAQSMLNKFSQISQNATAPAGPLPGANHHMRGVELPPAQFIKEDISLDDLLNGIPDDVLPPLALADGSVPFAGDASNDWFYPGRSVRNGMLPDVDLVAIEVMEI